MLVIVDQKICRKFQTVQRKFYFVFRYYSIFPGMPEISTVSEFVIRQLGSRSADYWTMFFSGLILVLEEQINLRSSDKFQETNPTNRVK
jgi:hypothetical protein